MLKNISQLECVIAEKTYRFLCDSDSPLQHVGEALILFISYKDKVESAVKIAQEELSKQQAEKPKDVVND